MQERTTCYHHNPRSESSKVPRIGEVVLLRDDERPRGVWNLARVLETYESSDGQIRSVKVITPEGRSLMRPVNHLLCLEIQERQMNENHVSALTVSLPKSADNVWDLKNAPFFTF